MFDYVFVDIFTDGCVQVIEATHRRGKYGK
jgi:hypothetical protein